MRGRLAARSSSPAPAERSTLEERVSTIFNFNIPQRIPAASRQKGVQGSEFKDDSTRINPKPPYFNNLDKRCFSVVFGMNRNVYIVLREVKIILYNLEK